MNATWTLQGQSGRDWDEVKRTFAERGVPAEISISMESLEVGRISWTQQRGTRPPSVGQAVTVYRNNEIFFRGQAMIRPWSYEGGSTGRGGSFQVELVDAMWTLAETPLAGPAGPGREFPQQSILTSVYQLLALTGAVQPGTLDIDPAYEPPFIIGNRTISGGSILAALVEMLKPLSDHACYLNYAASPPTFNVVRRRSKMEEVTLKPGRDQIAKITQFTPRPDLKPGGVMVKVAQRGANGAITYTNRLVGEAGGSQLVVISSPQLLPFVPPDDLPSVAIQTSAISGGWAEAKVLDSVIAQALTNGDLTANAAVGPYALYTTSTGSGQNTTQIAPAAMKNVPTGAAVTAGTWHRITNNATLPDFMLTDYNVRNTSIRVTGTYMVTLSGAYGVGMTATLLALQAAGRVTYIQGYISPGSGGPVTHYFIAVDYTIEGAIDHSYPTLQTIYQKAAYQYRTEPPNLGENLFNAQDFTPWEGEITFTPKMPLRRWLGCKINVDHPDDPAMLTAGAIVQSQTVDLRSGVVTIRCGTPLRVAMSDVTGKYRAADSKDTIAAT